MKRKERRQMGKIIEGRWDCSYCGAKGIRGSIRTCPNCGKTRGEDVKFYISDPKDYTKDVVEDAPDWHCSYCDTYNKNSEKVCRNCGHSRDNEDRDYFDIQKKKDPNYTSVTDKYVKASGSAKKTWTCESCGSENDADAYKCANCGKVKGKRQEYGVNEDENKEQSQRSTFQSYGREPEREFRGYNKDLDARYKSYRSSYEPKKSSFLERINFQKLAIFGGAVLFLLLMLFLLIPKNEELTVESFNWTYKINIEEYKTVQESDWSIPSGGRLQYSREEIRSYDTVLDHYETKTRQVSEQVLDGYDTVVTGHRDMGNGYFEEITSQVPRYRTEYRTETYEEPVYIQVPVYDTKYYYEIERWIYTRTVTTSNEDKKPYFGEPNLTDKERIKNRETHYVMSGIINDKTYHLNLDKAEWDKYSVGNVIPVKVNKLGIVTIVKEKD